MANIHDALEESNKLNNTPNLIDDVLDGTVEETIEDVDALTEGKLSEKLQHKVYIYYADEAEEGSDDEEDDDDYEPKKDPDASTSSSGEEEFVTDEQLQKELVEDKKIEAEEEKEIVAIAAVVDSAPDESYCDAVDNFMNDNFDEIGNALEALISDLRQRHFVLAAKQAERKEQSLLRALQSEDDFTDFGELIYAMLSHKVKSPTNSKGKSKQQ